MTDSVELANLAADFGDTLAELRRARLALDRAIITADQQGMTVADIATAVSVDLTVSYVFTVLCAAHPDRHSELVSTLPEDDGTGVTHDELLALTPLPPLNLIESGLIEFVRAGATVRYRVDPQFLANTPAPHELRRI